MRSVDCPDCRRSASAVESQGFLTEKAQQEMSEARKKLKLQSPEETKSLQGGEQKKETGKASQIPRSVCVGGRVCVCEKKGRGGGVGGGGGACQNPFCTSF